MRRRIGNGRIGDLILKTTDAGSTWNTVLSGTGYGVNSIFFPTDDIGYGVGIFGEIVKTTDAGNTWTYQNSGTLANLTSVYFTDDITGYAVGYNGNENNIETILKTINGGTTWDTLVNPTNVPLNCVVFTDPNTGYIAGDGSLIKTTNAGITWTVDTNGMGYMYYQNDFITVFFIGQDTGYVADLGGDLLKTTNAGTSWHFQTVAQGQGCSSMYFINSNTGYMVGEAEISQTLNGGVTWNQLSFGTNGGNQLYSVFFPDSLTGYAVGFDSSCTYGIVLKTINGGSTWHKLPLLADYELYSVFFTDDNTGYVVGYLGVNLKTVDGGETWTDLHISTMAPLNSILFITPSKGYIVSQHGDIFHTSDAGSTWIADSSGTWNGLYSIFSTDTATAYAVGNFATILKTGYGGVTFVEEHKPTVTNFTIYPNPANDEITIETSLSPVISQLSIMNLNGQVVLTRQITGPKNQLDVSTLPSGVYFVRLTNEKTVKVGKFVKQ